jgi:hypothetical protein
VEPGSSSSSGGTSGPHGSTTSPAPAPKWSGHPPLQPHPEEAAGPVALEDESHSSRDGDFGEDEGEEEEEAAASEDTFGGIHDEVDRDEDGCADEGAGTGRASSRPWRSSGSSAPKAKAMPCGGKGGRSGKGGGGGKNGKGGKKKNGKRNSPY